MGAEEQDGQLMNYLVRMVVPLRREFGRNLNVGQFLHDFSYAREVLDEAKQSQDPRLLEYALYVEKRLHGPRIADTPAPPPARDRAAPDTRIDAPAAAAPATPTEEELRARVLKKYTNGLR